MTRLAVIGGDAGGMSAASTALRRDPSLEVVAFERGPYTSFSACGIPFVVGGLVESIEDLVIRSPAEHRRRGLTVHTETEVLGIDLDRRELTVRGPEGERREGFDQLVYATGAEAHVPPFPGHEAAEPLHTLPQGERLKQAVLHDRSQRAVVIGGGYIGIEVAEALAHRGLLVTIVEAASQVMGQLDPDMAARCQEAAEAEGIRVLLDTRVEEILSDGHGRARGVVTSGGTLDADHVVVSIGVRPAVALAEAAGLQLGPSGAVAVDEQMRAQGHDGVWAAGDCVESWHRLLGKPVNIQLGTHANKQGRVAGIDLTGGEASFPGVIGTAATRICDVEIGRTGLTEKEAAAAGIPVVAATISSRTKAGYYPGARQIHVKAVAHAQTGVLLGAQITGGEGSAKRIDALATAVWTGMGAEEFSYADLSYAPPFSPSIDPVLLAAGAVAKKLG